jgi:ubiquinone/menaquinone biosynthesis C-methylase UbiE
VAFRGLRAEQNLNYVAADLSRVMLRRTSIEAERRGLRWIQFAEADVESLPFEDGTFDRCITYTGLHCFPDPAAAVREMARVLKPCGELRGTSVVKGAGIRQDTFVRLMQMGGVFGPGLASAERDGGLAYFSAQKAA